MITSRQWIAVCPQSFAQAAWSSPFFSLSPIEKATVRLKYYRLFIENNLRIDYKKRLTCFYELYGYYLEFLSARHVLHEPVDF